MLGPIIPVIPFDNIETPVYTDDASSSDTSNKTYYYVAKAVDEGQNESPYSNQADVTVQYPVINLSRGIRYAAIQPAVDDALNDETIQVSEGTYYEHIQITDKHITLTSTNPDDPEVVGNTIIDGNDTGTVVTLNSGASASIVAGFTIRNGISSTHVKGVYCSGEAVFKSCILSSIGYVGLIRQYP